jgi:prepilin-type N-terminal cleavage/methylation domain-containing protein
MKPFRQTKIGFTIIEVMIAIGIFSMILISIYSVWVGILKASKAARGAADNAQRARIAIRALEDALTTAQMFTANMPPQNQNAYYSFLADMSGDYGSLSFVAHLPATFPGVGRYGDHLVRRVKFTIEPDKDGGLDLVMRQAPMMHYNTDQDPETYSLVLAKDVQMFGFEFWGQTDPIRKPTEFAWIDHWESTNSCPQFVRIWLGLGKAGQNGKSQDFVAKIVALPTTAVQPDWQMPMGGGPRIPGRPGQPPVGQPPGNPPPGGGMGVRKL